MKFAYADPPYLGLAKKFYGHLHPNAADYDKLETHAVLVKRLCDEYPDGWAMSLQCKALKPILSICPDDVRVLSWVKPFCAFMPSVRLAYAWEPIIIRGGRKRTRDQDTVRDWLSESMAMKRGLRGAKPERLIWWLLDVLNVKPGDTIDDLFPGSGSVTQAIARWHGWRPQGEQQDLLLNDGGKQ